MSTGFDQVAVTAPRSSRFNLSHDLKTSMKMGNMVPINVLECLPGDVFNISYEAMFRMMPMIAPIMHKVDVSFHTFFVPNRILWSNWEKFIFPESATAVMPAAPYLELTQCLPSSLPNYLGIPVIGETAPVTAFRVNALPFAAYQRIFDDWFRSQDLDNSPNRSYYPLTDGLQTVNSHTALTELHVRGWEHDYFTSCLPSAQKGQPVGLPIDLGELPTKWKFTDNQGFSKWNRVADGTPFVPGGNNVEIGINTSGNTFAHDGAGTNLGEIQYNPTGPNNLSSLYADANGFTVNTTINDLRSSWALQQWLERNMRAGTRYREALQANFDVISSDARLDRAEYIGGSKGTLAISEVLQTQSSDATTPQANMAGHGIGVMGSAGIRYRCEEHGWIITICSIIPKTAYYQGLHKMFSRFDRLDYAFPDFAQLGEQVVKNKEIYLNPADGLDDGAFGYLPMYAEYRNLASRVSGQMATTLDFWHMGRKFATRPALNAAFIKCDATEDIFAVVDEAQDNIVAHIQCNINAVRKLPVYGIPAPLV